VRNFPLHVEGGNGSSKSVVVRLSGELDRATELELRSALDRAVELGTEFVLVDLADVTFLDSAALSVLIGARRRLPLGHQLRLLNVPKRIMRSLEVAGVLQMISVQAAGEAWPWSDVQPPVPDPGPV
jgi:anti-anti-sigma factor